MIIIKSIDELNHLLDSNDFYSDYNNILINNYYLLVDLYNMFLDDKLEYNFVYDENNRFKLLEFVNDNILNNDNINDDIKEVIHRLVINLSDYELGKCKLKSIDISQELKEKINKENKDYRYFPTKKEMEILTRIIKKNVINYDEKISKIIFSESFDDGLHKGITEELVINRNNIPHLLGLTSSRNSLYKYYRKCKYNSLVKRIKNNSKDENEFNRLFKEIFGTDYNNLDLDTFVNCKYNPNPKNEEELFLNSIYGSFPKEDMLLFFSIDNNLNDIVDENEKINNYIMDYFNIEGSLNEFLVEKDITKNNKFMKDFRSTFLYDYPLINYNELLLKNTCFYNMSLFENINSIVVDYSNDKSLTNSDVFLLCYDECDKNNVDNEIDEFLTDNMNIKNINSNGDDIEQDYYYLQKSLDYFRKDDRHYFEDMDKITSKFKKKILKRDMEKILKKNIISCFGFVENNRDELINNGNGSFNPFKHDHKAETNLAIDYEDYLYDYSVNGNVLPVKLLFDVSEEIDDMNYGDEINYSFFRKMDNKNPKKIIKMDRIIQSVEKERGHNQILNNVLLKVVDFHERMKASYDEKYSNYKYDVVNYRHDNANLIYDDVVTIKNYINDYKNINNIRKR